MQKEITIISFHESYAGDNGSHGIKHFPGRAEALEFIKTNMKADLEEAEEFEEEKYKSLCNELRENLMFGKCGKLNYTAGAHEYSVVWDFVQGDSRVSDDELITTIEQYCNMNRSQTDYDNVAVRATDKMHRYCQNEMYRLVASLIRAMATCRYDERNTRMHNRAEMIARYMNEYNL